MRKTRAKGVRLKHFGRRRVDWLRRAQGMRRESWSVLREAAVSVLAYELYPLGIATPSIPVFPGLRRPEVPPEVPVLFVHGLLHNTSTFAWIKQQMALAGWRKFRAVSLSTVQDSIPRMAEQVFDEIQSMRRDFGVEQVDVVAHSMGGILARYVLQLMRQDGCMRHLITLGTPHQGTRLSQLSWVPHLRELAPGSRTITELNCAPLPHRTQVTSVSGSLDIVLWPRDAAHWPGVRNICLRGVGHAGLLFSRRVIQIILAHLHPPSLSARFPFGLVRLPQAPATGT